MATSEKQLTIFYDGECPICRMEVNYYERLDRSDALVWQDICELSDAQLPTGKTREVLLGKFHVQEPTGDWHVGVDAFSAIWTRLPVFRRLAWIFRTPGLRQIAELGYRGFLAWQRRHRQKRIAAGAHFTGP